MDVKIYVGGLSPEVTDGILNDLFAPYGQIESAAVVNDRSTKKSRGFGFVHMPVIDEAIAAISALNGTQCMGSTLIVNEARLPS
jgi:RNA recognition motif-containing protein